MLSERRGAKGEGVGVEVGRSEGQRWRVVRAAKVEFKPTDLPLARSLQASADRFPWPWLGCRSKCGKEGEEGGVEINVWPLEYVITNHY